MAHIITEPAVAPKVSPTHSFNKSYILFISAVSALGGVLFGFGTAVISGTILFFTSYFNLNEVMLGWAVRSILVGCGLGAMITATMDLFICAFLFAAIGVGVALAESVTVFIGLRISLLKARSTENKNEFINGITSWCSH